MLESIADHRRGGGIDRVVQRIGVTVGCRVRSARGCPTARPPRLGKRRA